MTPLIVKCYLPGRRAQFVLETVDGGRARLAQDGEVCPPGLEEDVALELRCLAGQWFAEAERGRLRAADGSEIAGNLALSPKLMLMLGAATLVFDDAVDPRMPARPVQTRQTRPEMLASQETRVLDLAALGIQTPARAERAQAPAAKPRLAPPPQLKPDELKARRPGEHTPISVGPAPINEAPPEPEPAPLKPPRSQLKVVGYSALGVAVAVSALGMLRPVAAETEARATSARPKAASTPSAGLAWNGAPRPSSLPRSGPPSEKLAADLYATGDWEKARREYQALAEVPGADPVFAVIARALGHRTTRNKVKP